MSEVGESRVAIVCDAGGQVGVGHVMRCLALAEELLARSVSVEFVVDLDEVLWVGAEIRRRGLASHTRGDESALMRTLRRLDPDAIVCDGYSLSLGFLTEARRNWRTLVMVDGASGTPYGDVIVDQNLGAESFGHSVTGANLLVGCRYALIRDDVRIQRKLIAPTGELQGEIPRVLVVMGGTDAYGMTHAVLQALGMTRLACEVTAISGSEMELAKHAQRAGQTIQSIPPTSAFAELVAGVDLVISAAGSTTWEIFTVGTCAALVQVAENQALGYRECVSRHFAAGLGTAERLRTPAGPEAAAKALTALLASATWRGQLAARAWEGVDGLGRERVADELLVGLRAGPTSSASRERRRPRNGAPR